jgi:uncharacterized protein YecE (DUF72 family)
MSDSITGDDAARCTSEAEVGAQTQPPATPLGALFVGCAGWSYPHWRNKFYPPNVRAEHELQFYQQRFNACEINFTYHQMPTAERCEKWRRSSPPGFFLSLKAPKTLTHISPLSPENHPQWAHFISAAKALGPRLGPLLVQLPPSFALDLPRLRAMQQLLPKDGGVKVAFEFRHNSWFCEDVYDVMRRHNWALVKHALPSAGVNEQWHAATSDWTYVRLHGKKDEHVWDYSADELQPYADKIAELRARGHACFVYFLNDADARAPANAAAFFKMVRKAAGEKWEGLLGVEAGGAGVLRGMFGQQCTQQPTASLPRSEPTSSMPNHPDSSAPPATNDAIAPARSPGILRFFSRQPPPALAAADVAPPAKKPRHSDCAAAPASASASLDCDRAGSNGAPPVVSASRKNEAEVIILD